MRQKVNFLRTLRIQGKKESETENYKGATWCGLHQKLLEFQMLQSYQIDWEGKLKLENPMISTDGRKSALSSTMAASVADANSMNFVQMHKGI